MKACNENLSPHGFHAANVNNSMNSHDLQSLRDHAYGIKFGNYDMPHYKNCTDPVILYIKANQAKLRAEPRPAAILAKTVPGAASGPALGTGRDFPAWRHGAKWDRSSDSSQDQGQ
jgi:hypothetical protein